MGEQCEVEFGIFVTRLASYNASLIRGRAVRETSRAVSIWAYGGVCSRISSGRSYHNNAGFATVVLACHTTIWRTAVSLLIYRRLRFVYGFRERVRVCSARVVLRPH